MAASNIPVIVQGNSFSLSIPLQIYVIDDDEMVLQDYTPDPTDVISIQLKGDRRQYTYTPTVEGNICNIDLSGNELADNYSVVVTIVKADGQRLRSFRTDQFFIVESSDDLTPADIVEGLEENVIYLNSSIFVAGADGRGIVSIAKTATAGLVDTYTITYSDTTTSTYQVTNGAQGPQGVGITSIEKTSSSGLVDTYTITLSNGQTSTFEVTNGQDGHDLGLASIINNLDSDSTEDALSAAMGKELNEMIVEKTQIATSDIDYVQGESTLTENRYYKADGTSAYSSQHNSCVANVPSGALGLKATIRCYSAWAAKCLIEDANGNILQTFGTTRDEQQDVIISPLPEGSAVVKLSSNKPTIPAVAWAEYHKEDVKDVVVELSQLINEDTLALPIDEMEVITGWENGYYNGTGENVTSSSAYKHVKIDAAPFSCSTIKLKFLCETSWAAKCFLLSGDGTQTFFGTTTHADDPPIEIYIPEDCVAICLSNYITNLSVDDTKISKVAQKKLAFVNSKADENTKTSFAEYFLALVANGNTQVFNGKKIYFFGDSVTYGQGVGGNAYSYAGMIGADTGATIINKAVVGTSLAHVTNEYGWISDQITNDITFGSGDLVVVFGGTNDLARNYTLGTYDSTDVTTTCGALNSIISTLSTKGVSTSNIFVLMPMNIKGGAAQYNFVQELSKICENSNIKFVDLSSIVKRDDWESLYMLDALHPNLLGQKIIESALLERIILGDIPHL